jgi:iron complex outermembrane receptor protein
MRYLKYVCGTTVSAAALAICGAQPAFAQTEGDDQAAADARSGGVAEIVVTAQKRAENLQSVPVAVTAVTSEAIANARIENIADLRSIAPNLYVVTQPGGSSIPSTVMRGQVSGAASNPTVDNGISYYIDGVYLGALNGILFDINEIERIEIIRGPAGTLFGTNSTGGAINYITSGPKGEFGVKQDLSYARFGSFRSKTRIDTPEWNGLSASVSYLHNEKKNNVRNFRQTTIDYSTHTDGEVGKLTSVKNLGESTTDAVHVAVRWKDVVEGLTLDYKYDWSRQKSAPPAVYLLGFPDTQAGIGAYMAVAAQQYFGGPSVDDYIQTSRGKTAYNDNTSETITKTQSHLFVANYQANDWLSIKNTASWRSNKRNGFTSNLDGTGFLQTGATSQLGLLTVLCCSHLNQFSNELQLNIDTDKVTGTVGLFHYTRRTKPGSNPWGEATTHAFGNYVNGVYTGTPITDFERSFFYRVKQTAGYGQLTYHLTDKFDITGGIRYTQDDKTFFDTAAGEPGSTYQYSKGNFSFLGNVSYKANEDFMAYAKYSTSFIAGGTAAGPLAVDSVTGRIFQGPAITYGEEKAKSWEAGIKTQWFDRRLRANIAAFYVTYTGLQTPLFSADGFIMSPSGNLEPILSSQFTTNFGKARAYGAEWEFTAVPTEGLTLTWSGSYTDFDFKKISQTILDAGGVTDVKDYPEAQRPKFMTTASAQYVMPLVDDTSLMVRLDAAYRSSINVGTQQFSNAGFVAAGIDYDNRYMNDLLKQKGLLTLNARATVMDIPVGPTKAAVSVWGRNITNKQRLNFIANTGITAAALFDDPATYGVDLSIEF